ncbi:MAG: CDP-glucose 4,6-dehydratase, partial [Alphaproteobacteria bacterium]
LDVLAGYLSYAEALVYDTGGTVPNALNFGPPTAEAKPVEWLVDRAITQVRDHGIDAADWKNIFGDGPREAAVLALDASLAKRALGWTPRLTQEDAIDWTVDWHAGAMGGKPTRGLVLEQIRRFSERIPG